MKDPVSNANKQHSFWYLLDHDDVLHVVLLRIDHVATEPVQGSPLLRSEVS